MNEILEERILAVMRDGNPRLDSPTLEFLIQKQEWDAHGKVLHINHFNVLDACVRLKMRGLIRDDESGDWRLTMAGERTHETFKSDRGFPLMFQGPLRTDGKSVLTLEHYCKWHDIYCVTPHGKVHRLPWEAKSGYYDGSSRWIDDCPTPQYCRWLVTNNPEYAWDDAALAEIDDRIHRYREDL